MKQILPLVVFVSLLQILGKNGCMKSLIFMNIEVPSYIYVPYSFSILFYSKNTHNKNLLLGLTSEPYNNIVPDWFVFKGHTRVLFYF